MEKVFLLALCFMVPTVFAQSSHFEGLSLSLDYADNVFSDTSTPGGKSVSQNGIPSTTVQYTFPLTKSLLLALTPLMT